MSTWTEQRENIKKNAGGDDMYDCDESLGCGVVWLDWRSPGVFDFTVAGMRIIQVEKKVYRFIPIVACHPLLLH